MRAFSWVIVSSSADLSSHEFCILAMAEEDWSHDFWHICVYLLVLLCHLELLFFHNLQSLVSDGVLFVEFLNGR